MAETYHIPGLKKGYHLQPGEVFVTGEEMTISTVLGSCVAVCLYDPYKKIAGMNHVMLPKLPPGQMPSTRYGNVATFVLYDLMVEHGCSKGNLQVSVYGGANGLSKGAGPSPLSVMQVGEKNLEVTLKVLQKLNLKIRHQDTGGAIGRKIQFDSTSGLVEANFLRRFDFTHELGEIL